MKILLRIKADPRNIAVSSPSAPQQVLPVGSVVKNTANKQKFVKKSGNEFAYAAIQITPPITWKWDSVGEESWKILQDLYAEITPNNAPTGLSLSSLSAQENQTLVGTLSATDADIGDTLTYSVVSNYADGASFIITSGNELRFITAPDYETKNQYTVKVRATDTDNAFVEEQYVINISDVVENQSPTNISLSSLSIQENNSINQVIGTLSTTDADIGDTFAYSIVSGDVSDFNINGNQLRASSVFNYEIKNSYSVTIQSMDSAGATYQKTFNINITNQSEAPTLISISNQSINENSAINTIIGYLSVTAPTGLPVTYSIVPNVGDGSYFNINGNELRCSVAFNYEAPVDSDYDNVYVVRIRALVGNESYEQDIFITVNDVVERGGRLPGFL